MNTKTNKKSLLSLLLVAPLVACTPTNVSAASDITPSYSDGESKKTSFNGEISYKAISDPQNNVAITVSREKTIFASGNNSVTTAQALAAGDLITIQSDYKYVYLRCDNLPETILYLPYGVATYQIPDVTTETCYNPSAFTSSTYTIVCRKATDAEVSARRLLSQNPFDHVLEDEILDYTAETSTQTDSVSVENDDVYMYPHSYSNRVTCGETNFYTRNAIDGMTDNRFHGKYPFQSWGYDQKADAEYVVYFGRAVNLDQVSIWLRNDTQPYQNGNWHDNFWKTCRLEFSDGTYYTLNFKQSGDEQKFTFPAKSTTSIRIKDITDYEHVSQCEGYCALSEIKAYGTEGHGNETALVKAYKTTFGGKDLNKASTSNFHAADIANTINITNDAFIAKTESAEGLIEPDSTEGKTMVVKVSGSDWKDTVYYSALSDYYFSTGRIEDITLLRGNAQNLGYIVNGGTNTPHADWAQASETYLYLSDYAGGAYKYKDSVRNGSYCINRTDPTDLPTNPNYCKYYEKCDASHKYRADWTNMCFWWCDALYMALNVYTLLYAKTGDKAYVEKAYAGYDYFRNTSTKKLYNSDLDLWYRDYGRTDETTTSGKAAVWSRGNAWVMGALAKQLLYLDPTVFPTIYETYKADFIKMCRSIIQYQRTDGLWNASIIDDEYYPGKEATGSSGILYALCVGLELGILDSATYMPVVEKAYNGLTSCIINEADGGKYDNQVGYMQTTGYQTQNYKSEEYSKPITTEFGMGLFILGASAVMRLCSDYTQPEVRIIPSGR